MPNKSFEKLFELEDCTCDALVLSFLPTMPISRKFDQNFYIPCKTRIEELLGDTLREICGIRSGASHWADNVGWSIIGDWRKIEKRIVQGLKNVISTNDSPSYFEGYLTTIDNLKLESVLEGHSPIYRFKKGEKGPAQRKFHEYWSDSEQGDWRNIQKLMRKYTKEYFKDK